MPGSGCRMLLFVLSLLAAGAAGLQAAYAGANPPQWTIEQDTDDPRYVGVAPTVTNTNIDAVVLACEEVWGSRILQLQLYLNDDGPLQPRYLHLQPLKAVPYAAIAIDQRIYPVALLFADDYAVLADALEGPFPALSRQLADAMQVGSSMTIHFDLLDELPGQAPSLDSEAVVDLQAPGGREAIAVMRRCADSTTLQASAPRAAN